MQITLDNKNEMLQAIEDVKKKVKLIKLNETTLSEIYLLTNIRATINVHETREEYMKQLNSNSADPGSYNAKEDLMNLCLESIASDYSYFSNFEGATLYNFTKCIFYHELGHANYTESARMKRKDTDLNKIDKTSIRSELIKADTDISNIMEDLEKHLEECVKIYSDIETAAYKNGKKLIYNVDFNNENLKRLYDAKNHYYLTDVKFKNRIRMLEDFRKFAKDDALKSFLKEKISIFKERQKKDYCQLNKQYNLTLPHAY